MTPILPDRLCWSSAIGNFIINFGMLDYMVFEFLELSLPPDQFPKIKDEHFQGRIGRIKEHVSRSDYPAERKERFRKCFDRLEPVRELRNHIAHGHLLLRQAEDTKDLVMTLSLPRNLDAAYSPESRHLPFAELEKALGCLTELIEEFKQLTNHAGSENETKQRAEKR